MQTTTTTPAAKPVKKQWNVGVNPADKSLVAELCGEFKRPAAVKGAPDVAASEREIVEIALKVATDRRFQVVPVMETVDGVEVQSIDTDGQPKFETVDLFEKEWDAIKVRDYSETVSKAPTLEGLIASIRKYGKTLAMEEAAIDAMIAAALAGKKAEETPAPVEG